MSTVTVIGEALVDIIVDARGEVTSVVGGGPLNTARSIARLGVPAAFLGGVSTDPFGARIMRLLDQDGVRLGLGDPVPEPTTLAIAQIDESGAATYRFLLDGTSAATVTPQMALAHLDPESRAIHAGTLALVMQPLADALVAVVAAATDEQLVMIDPNCRPSVDRLSLFRSSLDAVVGRADVVKVSGDDLEYMFPGEPPLPAAQSLAADTDSLVLFTDGANAVHVITSGRREPATDVVLDVPRVPVVDTVGAGDSFSGGFLAWWMHQGLGRADLADLDRVVDAARFGIAVAGITCQRPGADPPHADEVPGGWA
jgi:fructokinase